jgi:hypothetical protein
MDDEHDSIDPKKSEFVIVLGRKGTGKSHFALNTASAWPGKILVIDVTNDVAPELTRMRVEYHRVKSVPAKWPMDEEDKPYRVVVWKPDSASTSFYGDVDRAFSLAFSTGSVMVWVDEVHTCCPQEKFLQQPSLRRVLVEGRHRRVSLLACGPRPVYINRLWLSQSDHVVMFSVPQLDDRRAVVDNLGYDRQHVEAMHAELREHEYLWFNQRRQQVTHYPAMPAAGRPQIPHHPQQ